MPLYRGVGNPLRVTEASTVYLILLILTYSASTYELEAVLEAILL